MCIGAPLCLQINNFLIEYMLTEVKSFEGGEFRGMNFEVLKQSDSNSFWYDGEVSKSEYHLPLRSHPLKNRFLSLSWKSLAKRNNLLKDIPADQFYELNGFWCAKSPESHIACYSQAIDFLVPVGSDILAVANGEIIELEDRNTEWGDGPEFRETLNFMTICHSSAGHRSYCMSDHSQYCHIQAGSASRLGLSVGSTVREAQKIGIVGLNGWTDRPHLHFCLFRFDRANDENPFGFKSLKPKFV